MKAAYIGLLATVGIFSASANAIAADVWELDLGRAKLKSAQTGKPIFLTFR